MNYTQPGTFPHPFYYAYPNFKPPTTPSPIMPHLFTSLLFQTGLNSVPQAPCYNINNFNLFQPCPHTPTLAPQNPFPSNSFSSSGFPIASSFPVEQLKPMRITSGVTDSTQEGTEVISFEAGDHLSDSFVGDQTETESTMTLKKNSKIEKLPWTNEDDQELQYLVQRWKCDWKKICRRFKGKSKPFSKHFLKNRLRILKHDPFLLKQKFTHEEDLLIATLVDKYDIDWKSIAIFIPNRTATMVKNRYYSYIHRNGLLQSLLDEAASLDPENSNVETTANTYSTSNFNPENTPNPLENWSYGLPNSIGCDQSSGQYPNFSYVNSSRVQNFGQEFFKPSGNPVPEQLVFHGGMQQTSESFVHNANFMKEKSLEHDACKMFLIPEPLRKSNNFMGAGYYTAQME